MPYKKERGAMRRFDWVEVRLGGTCLLLAGLMAVVRADGLPGEFVVTQRWRDLLTSHSPINNPAYMTEENYVSARGAFAMVLANSFRLWEMGATVPIGLYQSAGFTWLGEHGGDVDVAVWDGSSISKTGQTKSNQNHFFAASYAINPINRLSVGANLTLAYMTNFGDAPAPGVGIDAGITYRLIRHPLIGDHLVGVTGQNLLAPKINDVSYARNIRASWLAHIWEKRIEAGIDVDIKDFLAKADDFFETAASGETKSLSKTIEFDFNSRLGFWILRMFNAYFQIGSDYWGLAGGVNVPTINNGRDFQVLYQYMNMLNDDEATTHTFYFRSDIGKHREEIYARKMARLASLAPNDLYNRALSLFWAGKYWDAFFIFGRILAEFPDFFKNDWVSYYLGRCQEKMDMRAASVESYEETKKNYPRSNVVPYADLGLMRIHYRNDNDDQVAAQMSLLNKPTVQDSLKYHAFYIMGESHLRQDQYQKALQLFSLIPETHPEYIFAQHSAAVAHVLSNNMDLAIEALDNSIQAIAKSEAEKEIANRSYVLLGYIFYEGLGGQERALSKAVSALRRVPKGSYFYEDALLGLAWTALKAQQWVDCMSAAKDLEQTTDKVPLQCEAQLLQAYCLMMQKQYDQAVAVLNPAFERISRYVAPTEAEKATRAEKYRAHRDDYHGVAANAKQLALTTQTSLVVKQIDSLHTPQQNLRGQIHKDLLYFDEHSRRVFFSKDALTVRDDIEYALAKAQKMAGTKEAAKAVEKEVEKVEELDEEMEKLQKELEELDETPEPEPEE
ncbi:MAG: tetratricopeptide repeat protein [Chitinivibrionales bacterium]|nr:tetratricopeptide repeat protein [Chitinivibrionales bacterium]MBD3395040.1 tetratricopeptide repeat protein [Chitinivibrionales bacterium]